MGVITASTVLKREERRSSMRKLAALAAIAGVGVVGAGWYTGHWRHKDLREEVNGASSAVASVASAVTAAASAVASVVASSLPDPSAAPSASAEGPPGNGNDEPEQTAPTAAPSQHAANAVAAHGTAKPAAPKPHPAAKPHHKVWHKGH
jgi:hypothetical protein